MVHRPHCTLYPARLQVYSILHAVPHNFSADVHGRECCSHNKMIPKGAQGFIARLLMFSLELRCWTGEGKGPKATSGLIASESGNNSAE